MCDYSLHEVASRPAKVGDILQSRKFENSITGGFAAADAPGIAVCLRPGTEIAFDQDVVYLRERSLTPPHYGYVTIPHRVARFRQIDMERPHTHHDALEFPNGEIVLLTMLREGLTATVLQLPADGSSAAADAEPVREAIDGMS